MFHPL